MFYTFYARNSYSHCRVEQYWNDFLHTNTRWKEGYWNYLECRNELKSFWCVNSRLIYRAAVLPYLPQAPLHLFLTVYTWASARETLDFINIVTSPWGRRLGFPLLCLGNFLNTNTHAKFWYSLKALLSPFGNKSSKVGILWYFAAETIFLSSFSIFSDNIWSVVVNSWKTIRNIIPLPSQ